MHDSLITVLPNAASGKFHELRVNNATALSVTSNTGFSSMQTIKRALLLGQQLMSLQKF